MPRRVSFSVVLLACAACSPAPDPSSGSGQVVARIDGREITVLQLQQTLGATRARADDPVANRLALDALVDRTLLAARARSDGLDRDPAVLAQVQAAIDRIHAQAALERIAASVPRPGADSQRAFREANPALFAQRRVYTVDEVSFESAALDAAALRKRVASARRLDEVADWLAARGVAVSRRTGTLLPEDAGIELAATLQARAEGDLVLLGAEPSFRILALRRIEARPASGPRVDAWIERHLLEVARRDAVDMAVAAMRARADIALLREFRDGAPGPAAGPSSGPSPADVVPNPAVKAGGGPGSLDRGVGAFK